MVAPAVHTLLHVRDIDALEWEDPRPEWATASLRLAPWVVVRRLAPRARLWPVGVRGTLRAHRCAAWLPDDAVLDLLTPPMLVTRPCSPLLDEAKAILHAHGYFGRWGPGGSVGFELASGVPCVSPSSDLDLVVHTPDPIPLRDAGALSADLATLPVRVDVLLETPAGAVALAEYARGASLASGSTLMMLRTPQGPRLVADPWAASARRA